MDEIFKQYGSTIITVLAIIAVIGIITLVIGNDSNSIVYRKGRYDWNRRESG